MAVLPNLGYKAHHYKEKPRLVFLTFTTVWNVWLR